MEQRGESSAARRYDLDWLRVFATYLLFLFHVAKVFDPAPFYHIRNADLSFVFLILAGFIHLWHMPLFFLLAGWSIYSSLRTRGAGGFVKERLLKLFLPLVMGCVILIPPVKYLELRSGLDASYRGLRVAAELQEGFRELIPSGLPLAPPFHESFWQFLPTFYTHLERFSWAHLWFLAYLFTFTLLYLPLFLRLRRMNASADLSPFVLYAPAILLAAIQVALRQRWPGLQNLYDDWANFAFYSTIVVAGFLLAWHPGLERAVQREWKRALGIGLGATAVLLVAALGVIGWPPVILACAGIATWCFLVAILGFARQHLNRDATSLPYLAESAFPVYLLHQSAIVLIGYPLIQLPLGIAAKFFLLLVSSVLATLAVYHFVVRRFAVTRFLFGMKTRPTPSPPRLRAAYSTGATVIALAGILAAGPARAAGPEGLWYAEGGAAQVEIRSCANALCGRVVWLRSPFDENGCPWRDLYNRSEPLRERSVLGLEILRGLEPSSDEEGVWANGTIYDPTSGRSYRATLRLKGEDRLDLRGYLGIQLLGRTTTWIRVGAEERTCAASRHEVGAEASEAREPLSPN
jgi:uncharacterized protein (DUF2147 family)